MSETCSFSWLSNTPSQAELLTVIWDHTGCLHSLGLNVQPRLMCDPVSRWPRMWLELLKGLSDLCISHAWAHETHCSLEAEHLSTRVPSHTWDFTAPMTMTRPVGG